MIEMCDLLLEHASDQRRVADDPVIQAQHSAGSRCWREISGIRVILAHAYFHIEQDIVGNVIDNDVPLLRGQLQLIAESFGRRRLIVPIDRVVPRVVLRVVATESCGWFRPGRVVIRDVCFSHSLSAWERSEGRAGPASGRRTLNACARTGLGNASATPGWSIPPMHQTPLRTTTSFVSASINSRASAIDRGRRFSASRTTSENSNASATSQPTLPAPSDQPRALSRPEQRRLRA